MRAAVVTCYRGHRFGEAATLGAGQRDALIAAFGKPGDPAEGVLGGRRAVKRIDLSGIGPVVVKPYARGGAIRHFNRQTHVRWGAPRCAREMDWLLAVRRLGIGAPCPLAWADDGGRLFYRCWLVTRAIPRTLSLAQVGLQAPERAAAIFSDVGRQMRILIENRIHHKDMHPGNILVDDRENVYFIDFDKAAHFKGSTRRLAERYRRRWRRAVAKYGLPTELDQMMAAALDQRGTP